VDAVGDLYRHTDCKICGELRFDELHWTCPKCGGMVKWRTENDLRFLKRRQHEFFTIPGVRM